MKHARSILFCILLNLILMPAAWLCGSARCMLLVLIGCGNLILYLFFTIRFFAESGKSGSGGKGEALSFVILQLFLLFSLTVSALSDILIRFRLR